MSNTLLTQTDLSVPLSEFKIPIYILNPFHLHLNMQHILPCLTSITFFSSPHQAPTFSCIQTIFMDFQLQESHLEEANYINLPFFVLSI